LAQTRWDLPDAIGFARHDGICGTQWDLLDIMRSDLKDIKRSNMLEMMRSNLQDIMRSDLLDIMRSNLLETSCICKT